MTSHGADGTLTGVLAQSLRTRFSQNRDAGGRLDRYGIEVRDTSPDGSSFNVVLAFKAGEEYCCFEPGCHFAFYDRKTWEDLRSILKESGLEGIPRSTIRQLLGVVEAGARATVMGGKPETAEFRYEAGPYLEPGR